MQGTHAQETRVGVGEAAQLADLSVDTIRRAADAGKLPHTRTPGGQRRFKVADVLALVGDPSPVDETAPLVDGPADVAPSTSVGTVTGEASRLASPVSSLEEA